LRLARLLHVTRSDNGECLLHASRVLELEARASRLAREAIELLSQCVQGGPARNIPHLRELVALSGQDSLEAKRLTAALLFHEGRRVEAVQHYRDLAAMGVSPPGVSYRIAEAAMEENKWDEAEALLTKATRRHPDNARLQYLAGEMWLRRDAASQAVVAFRKATALNGDFAPAWYRMAWLASQPRLDARGVIESGTRVLELEDADHPLVKETLPLIEGALKEAQ
jgi:predicted Zn-dependent protease